MCQIAVAQMFLHWNQICSSLEQWRNILQSLYTLNVNENGEMPVKEAGQQSFKDELVEKIGFVPTTTPEDIRLVRGTNNDESEDVVQHGWGVSRGTVFQGNAEYLSTDADEAAEKIASLHRGARTGLIFAIPNIYAEWGALKNARKIDAEIRPELPFAEPDPTGSRVRIGEATADYVVPPEYVEGYYDKDEKAWHPNPLFWTNVVKKKAIDEGWTEEQLQAKVSEMRGERKQKGLARLREENNKTNDLNREALKSLPKT